MSASLSPIFLVEDDENDVFIMKRAMSKAKLSLPVHVAINGKEAIEYLSGAGKYTDRGAYPLPQSIFLDLKIPYFDGFEVFEWIRKQPSLGLVNVFVLTSSPEDRDRERAQSLGAKAYLVKPPTAQMLLETLKAEAPQSPDGRTGDMS